ncbi:hypothetical protein IE4803_PD00314 (plasmid) [Rhizobium etli bv. phaseoli str. IE4803]|nr:hypothetical protein IE4803_PD00314 [Rhizobium etli bv. phaseoli str. IE4803]
MRDRPPIRGAMITLTVRSHPSVFRYRISFAAAGRRGASTAEEEAFGFAVAGIQY